MVVVCGVVGWQTLLVGLHGLGQDLLAPAKWGFLISSSVVPDPPWIRFQGTLWIRIRTQVKIGYEANSVAEPKLFIFGSGSDFDHNFGSSYSYSHILAL